MWFWEVEWVGMGGMFSIVKVRRDQKPGDYKDPGWYKHPPGEVAYEFTGTLPDRTSASSTTPRAPAKWSACECE